MKRLITACCVIVGCLPLCAADVDTAELLRKALFEEEANHNLQAAITAYSDVVAQIDKDRKLAATAVFRLGECYRKLGKTNEATAQYQRVVRDFSEQQILVDLSRKSLASFTGLEVGPRIQAGGAATTSDAAQYKNEAARLEAQLKMLEGLDAERQAYVIAQDGNNPLLTTTLQQLAQAETNLKDKMVDFGSEHPDVQRARAFRAEVEKRVQSIVDAHKRSLEYRIKANRVAAGLPTDGSDKPASFDEQGIARAKALFEQSPDLLNAPGTNGLTPLEAAAGLGQLTLAEYLVDKGARLTVGSGQVGPLHQAAAAGHNAMVEMLLRKGAKPDDQGGLGVTALHVAAWAGHEVVTTTLLKAGAPVNAKLRIGGARQAAVTLATGRAFVGYDGQTPLHSAVGAGHARIVELLLKNGADASAKAEHGPMKDRFGTGPIPLTPLDLAAISGSIEIAKLLLAAKADPNAGNALVIALENSSFVDLLLSNGGDPNLGGDEMALLHRAAGSAYVPTVKVLLERGADPKRNVQGREPLHVVSGGSSSSHRAIAELLIAKGADVNATDPQGRTPLYYASEAGALEMVNLYLERNADPNVQDASGKSPIQVAKNDQIRRVLRQKGAMEDLPRLDAVTASRAAAREFGKVVLTRESDFDAPTLYESLGMLYAVLGSSPAGGPQQSLGSGSPWPDFSRVHIRRLDKDSKRWSETAVDVAAQFREGRCDGDTPLRWGDVLEIPEVDHSLQQPWIGIDPSMAAWLRQCLEVEIELIVNGQSKPMKPSSSAGGLTRIPHINRFIRPVLLESGRLLASSDLTRVKVTRKGTDGQVKEWTLDCSDSRSVPRFLLRNGDVVEVPAIGK